MIPETPAFYKLALTEIHNLREQANKEKTEIDAKYDKLIRNVSSIISDKRASCTHEGVILYKESASGRPYDPDVYVCTLCTSSVSRPPISAEIVRVSQEELHKFFCK